jgi:hypothetical protein
VSLSRLTPGTPGPPRGSEDHSPFGQQILNQRPAGWDEKLTDWRDGLPFVGLDRLHEKALRPTAAGREGLTRCFEPSSYLLDAEEVRGSNLLAPTTKGPGQRAFSFQRSWPNRALRAKS